MESESSSEFSMDPLPSLAVIHVSQDPHPDQAFVRQLFDDFRGKFTSSEFNQLESGFSSYIVAADTNLNVEVCPPGSELWESGNDGRKVCCFLSSFF